MKLKSKMILMFTLTAAVSIASISTFSITNAVRSTRENVNSAMTNTVTNYASNFDGWINKNAKVVESTNSIIGLNTDGKNINASYLQAYKDKANADSIASIYVATEDGGFVEGNGWIPDTGFVAKGRDWYTGAVESGKQYISDPYVDAQTQKMMMAISYPLKDKDGKVIGVTSEDVLITSLLNQVKNLKYNGTGTAFLINKNGKYMAHTNEDFIGKEVIQDPGLAPIVHEITSKDSGTATYIESGKPCTMVYKRLATTGWTLCFSVDNSVAFAKVTHTLINDLIISALCLIVVIALAILMSLYITKPILGMTGLLRKAADGDFTIKVADKDKKRKDEIGIMENSFSDMLATIREEADNASKIANGNLDFEIKKKSDKDILAFSMSQVMENLKALTANINMISDNAVRGNIEVRGDATKFEGDYKKMVEGFNSTLDAVSEPINGVRKVVNALSVNDFTQKVDGNYNGVFKDLADDVNNAIEKLVEIQNVIVKISEGDISLLEEFEANGKLSENDKLIPSIISMMETIKSLIEEVKVLSEDAVSGNIINARGDAGKFEGGYKEIVEGFNSTLDAVSAPLSNVMEVLNNYAANDLTEKCSEDYNGDFNKLAKSVNAVYKNLTYLKDTAVDISNGDISKLSELKSLGKQSEHDELIPAFVGMMENIKLLIEETKSIASAAAEGQLDVRGDTSLFDGEYLGIIEAINSFLEAVEKPTNEITALMDSISHAKYGETIDGEFKGQFEVLVNAVNKTSTSLDEVIHNVTEITERMAAGDFSSERIEAYQGDLSSISDSFNAILDSLNELFSNVSETASQVAAGSRQVSDGSQQLSAGATQQASSVEELSSSIEEIAAKTKNNAQSAVEANNFVDSVKASASDGNNQMGEMLKSMSDISESSKNISKIIKVIDDIAFQTNILALNAAVEAARAGQAGKGFSVVADEVRNLASKSAAAVKDTTALIEETANRVESGTKIANNTAESFTQIVDGIDKVSGLVSHIATASNEQSNGILQINNGLEEVSRVVQTNSATSEESAAASEELSSQAVSLKEQISKFILRGMKAQEEHEFHEQDSEEAQDSEVEEENADNEDYEDSNSDEE